MSSDALKDAVERVAAFKESRIASAYPTLIAAIDTILADLKAKDEALISAAQNLDACAVAIKKGGKSNGRHLLVEGWAQRARALSPETPNAE